jgi:hypothetical protein
LTELAYEVLAELGGAARETYRLAAERLCLVRGHNVGKVALQLEKWDCGNAEFGERRFSLWSELARMCLECDVPMFAYIARRFSTSTQLPLPTRMLSRSLMVSYKKREMPDREASSRVDIAGEMRILEVQVALRLKPGDCDTEVRRHLRSQLSDPTLLLTPLVRVAIASKFGERDIVRRWLPHAVLQYAGCPKAANESMGEWLPDDVIQVWNELRNQLTH